MTLVHQVTLYLSLGFLGFSLLIPGLAGVFQATTGHKWLVARNVDAANHLRALNGMMAALGMISLWTCWDLPRARVLVEVLGALMVFLVIARVFSTVVDGVPGRASKIYLGVEAMLGAIFLAWPPPAGL
jgi:hypothetical protein